VAIEPESDVENRPMPGAVAYGAFVGLLHGAAAGIVCCWLAQQMDYCLPVAAIGAAIGAIIGCTIGHYRRHARNGNFDPDIGMWTAIGCGLIPAILIFVCIGVGFGRQGIGAMFVCPMVALLTGGVCDRIYEALLRRR
jgi:hypothetical protein